MRTAFCINVFDDTEIDRALKHLSGLGYDGVEIWKPYIDRCDIFELKQSLNESNLSVEQLCPYFNLTATEELFVESLREAKECISLADFFDCKKIRVFSGKVASGDATDKQWSQAVKGLQKMCAMGLDKNIDFVLEIHPGGLHDTSAATLRLIEDVAMPNLKINLQLPLYGGEDIYQGAEKLAPHVNHFHVHNWIGVNEDGATWKRLAYLDEPAGEFDFKRCLSILKNNGFDGTLSIEHGNHLGKADPYKVAEREIEYLKTVVSN